MSDIQELLEHLRKYNEASLWDAQDIATYLKLAKSTVQSHVICKADFPKAIKINGTRRWKPTEVRAWAERHREVA